MNEQIKKTAELEIAAGLLVQYLFVAPIVALMPNRGGVAWRFREIERDLSDAERELGIIILPGAKQAASRLIPNYSRGES